MRFYLLCECLVTRRLTQLQTVHANSLTTDYHVTFFYQFMNIISIIFSFTVSICLHLENGEWVALITLVLFIDISVNWPYHNHWFLVIINIVTILILHTCLWRYKMLPDAFECYRYSSSSSHYQNLLPLFVTPTNCPSAGFVGDQICWRH